MIVRRSKRQPRFRQPRSENPPRRPVSYKSFWATLLGTLICIGPVVWSVLGSTNIPTHWRILIAIMLVVFVVASLATTEIIPWHSTSLAEWRQPKVLGSVTLLLLGAAAFVVGIANVFAPDPARQNTLDKVAIAVGASPADVSEQRTWEGREVGSCDAIEGYLRRYPIGHYAREATALLATRRNVATTRTTVTSHELPLTEIPDGNARESVAAARGAALERATHQGNRICNLYATELGAEVSSVKIAADRWSCSAEACGFEGRAICTIERQETRQICGEAGTK